MPHRDKPDHETASDEHLIRQLASLDPPYTEPHWGQFRWRVLARLEQRQTPQPETRRRRWMGWPASEYNIMATGGMMVGIIVLGLLTAIVMPRLVGHTDKARYEQAKIQIRIFEDALMQFQLDHGRFPTTEEGLQALVQDWPDGAYLDKPEVPLDPWGNEYVYTSPGQYDPRYDILSFGADGLMGGEDYDKDVKSWGL